jgi:hypothetical protein
MSAIELVSPLSPDECAARLREATDRGGPLSWFGSKPVVGRVSGRFVRLHTRIGYRNSFQTCLTGTLEPRGEGTVFRGRMGLHPLVTIFLAVWFAGAVVIGATLFVTAVRNPIGGGRDYVGLFVPPGLLGFGVALVWIGRYLARGEERFLVAFVAEVLGSPGETHAGPRAAADRPRP